MTFRTLFRRGYDWLTDPSSPSEYPYRDIAANRSLARGLKWVGYLAIVVAVGNDIAKGTVDEETAYFVFAVLAVVVFVARGLRMQALRWQVEELEKRTRDEGGDGE